MCGYRLGMPVVGSTNQVTTNKMEIRMKRATKFQFLPCRRSLRRTLDALDRKRKDSFKYDLQRQMEHEVPRPVGSWRVVGNTKKWVPYEGP
jgi:hypothetical protein